jgi:hypothetical protein
MFAPKLPKPRTKAAPNPANDPEQRSTLIADRSRRPVEQVPLFSPSSSGNDVTPELLSELNIGERVAVPTVPRRASWNFGKVAIFPPSRTTGSETQIPTPGVIQTKLAINDPGDSYEQEADRIAEQVVRTPESPCACGGECPRCAGGQADLQHVSLQTKRVEAGYTGQVAAPPIVDKVLRSTGQPLDAGTRAFMEPRFGYDFSRVRVHSGPTAEQSADEVKANAYTVQNNIVFAAGKFAPDTPQGRHLLAHELAHVVQQNGAMAVIQRDPKDHAPHVPVEPASVPADRAAYQRYLETLREMMAKPNVSDPKLAEIVEKLYRDHPEIGSGSTAAAIRNEVATGMATKGTRHLQAGRERMNMLSDWLKNQEKLRNLAADMAAGRVPKRALPGKIASASDVEMAEHLFKDLQQSVDSGYYAEFEITFHPPPAAPGGADPAGGTGPASGESPAKAKAPAAEKAPAKSTAKAPPKATEPAAPVKATETASAPAKAPAASEPAGGTSIGTAGSTATREMGEVVESSIFRSAGRLLAREAPGLVLQLAVMLLFPPKVNIHNDKAGELSRKKLEPAVQDALKRQKALFEKLLNDDSEQLIYANVTAKLYYDVAASASGDLEVYLVDVSFVDMTINREDDSGTDPKFDVTTRPITRQATHSLLLYEPEAVTAAREWAEAQQKYQECLRQYGTGHIPRAAGVEEQPNPDEGPCIVPHMKPMEGP